MTVKIRPKVKRRVAQTKMEAEVTDALARELLGVCMATLRRYGIDRRHLGRLAGEAIASGGEIPTTSKMFRDTDRLGDLANEWTENAAYVDRSGRPKVLPISGGEISFAALVAKYFRGRSTEEILEMGCRTRVLERVGTEKVAQFGGCVIFAGHPILMLVHAIQSVRWFLNTTVSNANPRGPSKVLPDRKACTAVPADCLPEFIKVMRQPLINLVEMGNRWLAAHATARRTVRTEKKITMGIHAYLFHDRGRT